MADAHDDETDAFYSPLRRGNSSAALAGTPRSDAATPSCYAPLAFAPGSPRAGISAQHSPWAETHQRRACAEAALETGQHSPRCDFIGKLRVPPGCRRILRSGELSHDASPLRDGSPRRTPFAAHRPGAPPPAPYPPPAPDSRDYDTDAAAALHPPLPIPAYS